MAKKIDCSKLSMECIKFMLLREILILKYDGCVKFSTAKTTHNLYIATENKIIVYEKFM